MNRKQATFLGRYLAETGALAFDRLPAPGLAVRPRWRVLTADALAPVSMALVKMGYIAIVGSFAILEKGAHERQGRGGEGFLALPMWSIAALAPGSRIIVDEIAQWGARIDNLAAFDPIAVVGLGYAVRTDATPRVYWQDVSAEKDSSHVRKLGAQLYDLTQERWRYDTASALVSGVGVPVWTVDGWRNLKNAPDVIGVESGSGAWQYATQLEINAAARRYGTFVSVEGERL